MDDHLLTTAQVAARLGQGIEKIRKLLRSKRFPNAVKYGATDGRCEWRVPASDVDAYLASLKVFK